MTKINSKNFKEACKGSAGNKSIIAQKLDVSRSAITQCLKRNQKFREIYDNASKKIVDKARSNVNQAVDGGDLKTSKWLLERRAEEYKSKEEITHKGDVQIQLRPTMKEIREKNKKGK